MKATVLKGTIFIETLPDEDAAGQLLAIDPATKEIVVRPDGDGDVTYTPQGETTATVGGIASGTDLGVTPIDLQDLLDDILYPPVSPEFTAFSVTGQATTVEVGEELTSTRTFTWSIALGTGTVATIDIYDITDVSTLLAGTANDGSEVTSINTIQLNTNGATQSWRGVANNTTPAETINSSPFTVTARFYRFYGPAAATPTDSATVRALPDSAFQTANANTFTLNTGTTHNTFFVALPPDRTIVSVIDETAFSTPITSEYIFVGTVDVEDAGATDRTYNLYRMTLGAAYAENHEHVITTA